MTQTMQSIYQINLNDARKDMIFIHRFASFIHLQGDQLQSTGRPVFDGKLRRRRARISYFRERNSTVLCLYLLSLYEEHRFVAHVTQRLMICYFIYRLKDLWPRQIVDKSGIYSHPYLLVLLKIFWNHMSPPGTNSTDKSLLHLCGTFPKITAQEAHFVGPIVADSSVPADSTNLQKISPLKAFVEYQLRLCPFFDMVLKTDQSAQTHPIFVQLNQPEIFAEIQRIVLSLVPPSLANFKYQSLSQCIDRSSVRPPNTTDFRSSFTAFDLNTRQADVGLSQSSLYNHRHYSYALPQSQIAPPPHLSQQHNNAAAPGIIGHTSEASSQQPQFRSSATSLDAYGSSSGGPGQSTCAPAPGVYGYQMPPGMTPAEVMARRSAMNDMSTLAMHQSNSQSQLGPIGSRPMPIGARPDVTQIGNRTEIPGGIPAAMRASYSASPSSASTATFQSASSSISRMPEPIGLPAGSHARSASPSSSLPSTHALSAEEQKVEDRQFAISVMKRIIEGGGLSLGKTYITKLLGILSTDREILASVEVSPRDFNSIVDSQPDLAAEILLQTHARRSSQLYSYFEVILTSDLSVQSMVAVSRYITSCERASLMIPEEFLNSYITYCIQTCEKADANHLPTHRMVRMVCVFFTSLVRLANFNVKPRVAEMQSFSTMFSSVKETSQLYQAIAQLK
ncbi:CCR4-NOT transcription complex subunit 11 [Aphelenchoides besseyi]|nr:CCR4-NOT transcription complex subunit 11 [Aphelenchoides besseyi]